MLLRRCGFKCVVVIVVMVQINRFGHGPIGKFRLNPGIKPRMYLMSSTVYEKSRVLLAGTCVKKHSTVAYGFSPIKI